MSIGDPNSRTVATGPVTFANGPHMLQSTAAMPVALGPIVGCGEGGPDGWWCHGSCRRHGRCMYVRRVPRAAVEFALPDRGSQNSTPR